MYSEFIYKMSNFFINGVDLLKSHNSLFLTNNKDLASVYLINSSGNIATKINPSNTTNYSYIEISTVNVNYFVTINTKITIDDSFNMVVVGGGGSGYYTTTFPGETKTGGGGGGGILSTLIDYTMLPMGTQLTIKIGNGGRVGNNGNSTILNYFPSNTRLIESYGGNTGTTTIGGNGGSAYNYLSTINNVYTIQDKNNGGYSTRGQPNALDGEPPNAITLDNTTFNYSGGGGPAKLDTSTGPAVGYAGGGAANGYGGTSAGQVNNNYDAVTFGGGGGATGGKGSTIRIGGNGNSGCVLLYWKTRL